MIKMSYKIVGKYIKDLTSIPNTKSLFAFQKYWKL